MDTPHEHVGPKLLPKIKTYILTSANLKSMLCLRYPVWLRKLLTEQHHPTEAAGKNIGDTKFGRKWTRTRK